MTRTNPINDIVTRWREMGMDEEFIQEQLPTLRVPGAADGLRARLEDIIAGRLENVDWPWKQTTGFSPSLLPGCVTVFAGSPGASKSFAIMQCMASWLKDGYSCWLLAMEGTREDHLQRALAQVDRNSELTDWKYIKANPLITMQAMDRHEEWMDEIGARVQCINEIEEGVSYDNILDWLQCQAARGGRVMVVDPITSASNGDGKPWIDDKKLINQAKKIAGRFACSIIFVSHPSKNAVGPAMDSLAGGAALQQHSDFMMWLQAMEPTIMEVAGTYGRREVKVNRIMYLLKTRHGKGHNARIAFNFSVDTLTLDEQGKVYKILKKQEDN